MNKRVVGHERRHFLKKVIHTWNITRLGILVLSQLKKNVAHVQRLPELRSIIAVGIQCLPFLSMPKKKHTNVRKHVGVQ